MTAHGNLPATAAHADQIGNIFEKYMPHLHPFYWHALKTLKPTKLARCRQTC
jgi:hypothetical protein